MLFQTREALNACRSALHSLSSPVGELMSIKDFNRVKQSIRNELEEALRYNSFWVYLVSMLPSMPASSSVDLRKQLFAALDAVTVKVCIVGNIVFVSLCEFRMCIKRNTQLFIVYRMSKPCCPK